MRIGPLGDRPELIAELAQHHFREWGPLRPGETPLERAVQIQAICGRSGVPSAFVATEGALLLGSAFLIAHDLESRKDLTPWVAGVFVVPEARRRGVGSALMTHVAEQAKNSGIAALYLYTTRHEDFYSGLGWTTMSRCTQNGQPVVVMSRELRSAQE